MMQARFFKFLNAAGKLGITSVVLSLLLFVVSIYEHATGKNLTAFVFVCLVPIFFAVGAFLAWSGEHDKLNAEFAKNSTPSLRIELLATFFDVSPIPHTRELQTHVYAYLRVTNLRESATLIKSGTLTLTVGGQEYIGHGDDVSKEGRFVEHTTDFKLGGEKEEPFMGGTYTPIHRLLTSITAENPLRRGIHREGYMVFTFRDPLDWDHENRT